MKGTATITLTDAKTGEVVSSTVEHNLVTNALRNIFNPCPYTMVHNMNYSKLFKDGLPMWKNLLSGVMLLGNRVTEDADNIFLSADTIPIGTAGSPYSGTNITRGTFNENESYETENGYHFTWDFGTDKANGTIRCVALTSRLFGDAGFQSGTETDGSFLMDAQNIEMTRIDPTLTFEYAIGQYVATTAGGIHLFVELDSSGNLVFRRYKSIDTGSIGINDTAGLSTLSEPIEEITVTPQIEIAFDERFFLDTDRMVMYYFGSNTLNPADNTTTIHYTGISIDSFTTVETKSLTIPKYCGSYYIGAVYGGHIYFLTPDGLSEFDESGNLIKDHTAPYAQNTLLFMHNGCLMSSSPSGDIYCYCWGDETTKTALGRNLMIHPNPDLPAPYAAFARRSYHQAGDTSVRSTAAAGIVSGYMATINNLTQPLTKTAEHTLKISYDITN